MTVSPIDAPLLPRIAPMMAAIGTHLCHDACRAYHRAWGYQRLYGVLPAVGRDHDALLTMLRAQVRAGARSVLISGSADAGLLAYVLQAMQDECAAGRIVVVDLCPTPLAVCTWYGRQAGVAVETWCGRIQVYAGSGFDLVVSHNFLNSIPVADRTAVCRVWHDSLRPGGRAAMINQIKPGEAQFGRRFDAAQVQTLVRDVLAARARSDHADLIEPNALASLIAAYAETREAHRFRSDAELAEPLEAAGLRIVAQDAVGISLPASASAPVKRRLALIAERPE